MKNQYEIDYQQGYDRANDEWLDKVKQAMKEISRIKPVGATISDNIPVFKSCDEIKLEALAILNELIESED